MIKQRMPYWLYALEELRCDLTAFRAAVELEAAGVARARLVQYAVVFDRALRFPLSGTRVRNYDGLGGQLLFAYLRQHGALSWTDNRLTVDWDRLPEVVLALLAEIEDLYWRSIDRPEGRRTGWRPTIWSGRTSSRTRRRPGPRAPHALPWEGAPKELTDAVRPDEFPLSMFFETCTGRSVP